MPGLEPFGWAGLTAAAAIALLAGIVRGFGGFGSALVLVPGIALLAPPVVAVPLVLLVELAASLRLLPMVWRDIAWREVAWIALGAALAVPFGVWLLAIAPASVLRVAIAVVLLVAVFALWRGALFRKAPGPPVKLAAGAASGMLAGATGMPGPPVILFYAAAGMSAAVTRASLSAYFLVVDVYGIAAGSAFGLIGWHLLMPALVMVPALVVGIAIGARGFARVDEARFRRVVLGLLTALALVALVQGVSGLI